MPNDSYWSRDVVRDVDAAASKQDLTYEGWDRAGAIADARAAVEAAYDESDTASTDWRLPVSAADIEIRTTANRVDLADDVPAVEAQATYEGYLDVVMHGDEHGTQAHVNGRAADFTLEQTARLIESSPAWHERPIRLWSCETGSSEYAQDLADRIRAPVYAPDGLLYVSDDGTREVRTREDEPGLWRRFEPRPTDFT